MCIIIAKKRNKIIKESYIKNCLEKNADGFGFAFIHENQLKIIKSTKSSFKSFKKLYEREILENKLEKSPILFHFRTKTIGKINLSNTHPFFVFKNKPLAFAHNGTILNLKHQNDKMSDTVILKNTILSKMPENFLTNKCMRELLTKYIGFSKLAFLDIKGNFFFINEKEGEWEDDIWYSNSGYKHQKVVYESYYSHPYNGYGGQNKPTFPITTSPKETQQNHFLESDMEFFSKRDYQRCSTGKNIATCEKCYVLLYPLLKDPFVSEKLCPMCKTLKKIGEKKT